VVAIESDEGNVLISGDISISPQRTVEGLKPPPFHPDLVILESTYGGRLHANRAAEERRLVDAVAAVTAAGGKVLIPAFALGRAQEVLLTLAEFRRRGELPNVTVWVDGMVRAICGAFGQFPEALSRSLQEGGPRFFDEQTRPVQYGGQRNQIVWDEGPAVIVSSSGMLSGGPSVFYAQALAGQPQHAILLTGYQDEEAPGRRLQELAERGRGTLKLGKDKVDVQCHIGTYSLSAHADEAQLVSLVEVLDPKQVLLVHGDAGARESLATALRQRGRQVRLPGGGQAVEFSTMAQRTRRQARGLGVDRPLDARSLWLAVGDPGGGTFSAADLALDWWDEQDRADELAATLLADDLYFFPHPNWPGLYQARTREQVELSQARRERLAALPDLHGQLLAIRDAAGTVRLVVAADVGSDHFCAAGEETPYAPEAILDLLGPAEGVDLEQVECTAADIAPREVLPDERPRPLDELAGRLNLLPDPVAARAALALALLRAGAAFTPAGYVFPLAARTAGLMEPNQALAAIRDLFPPEAGLRKCGYQRASGVITLTLDFPDRAVALYRDTIAEAEALTGWQVEVNPEANQQALNELVQRLLPTDWTLARPPAVYRQHKEVAVTIYGGREKVQPAEEAFLETTGYTLLVTMTEAPDTFEASPETGERWEINAAYAELRRTLAESTLYRTSLKGERIVLSFISPQVGARYRDEIAELERLLGWPLEVNKNPNQGAILAEARSLVQTAGGQITKGPSIFVARGEVTAVLAAPLNAEVYADLQSNFEERTGYGFVLHWPGGSASV